MKILILGTDKSALDKDSKLSRRINEYEKFVGKFTVIIPRSKNKTIGLFKILFSAGKILKKEKYDLITVQDAYYLAFLGWALARMFGIGLNLQIHGFEKYRSIRRLLTKFVIPRADSIRVVSQRLKKQLIEEFGVKEEKITVVPIYVPVASSQSSVVRQKKDKFVFLTVGRLVPVKNIGMQIEAIKELKVKSEKLKVELWIVGEGPERKNLEFRIKNLRLQDRVKFFGWQEDVGKFYEQANAFLLTSYAEGWPLVIVEAASFGLPIIMTDVGSAGELIRDGESGIVIPVGDKEKLAEAMIKIIEDGGLRKGLGEGARQAVSRLPSKEEILRLYKESWQKALIKD